MALFRSLLTSTRAALRHRAQTRRGLRALERIADALEQQNRFFAAAHPEVVQRLQTPEAVDSAISYANPTEAYDAEQIRQHIYRHTGRLLNDEELIAHVDAQLSAQGRE